MDIILIGAPGAGKGTQAEKLSQLLGVRHIASGDAAIISLMGNEDLPV